MLLTVGWSFAKLGNIDAAVRETEKALKPFSRLHVYDTQRNSVKPQTNQIVNKLFSLTLNKLMFVTLHLNHLSNFQMKISDV